jgi:hypothetical protein
MEFFCDSWGDTIDWRIEKKLTMLKELAAK